jgi:rubrerythrin
MENSAKNMESLSIESTTDLLAHALALELEASERYAELAEQMQTHNNPDLAELFAELSRIEKLHVARVLEQAVSKNMQDFAATIFRWEDPEGPETTDMGEAHYLMTPYHALRLALHNEKRAHEYFNKVAADTTDIDIGLMAVEMAAEEQEHVVLIEEWLTRYPQPTEEWSDDPDPAVGRD